MKFLPLLTTNLKGFTRNWKSVALLLGVPLLLIVLIVASFNPGGLRPVPAGLIDSGDFNVQQYQREYLTFLDATTYGTLEQCIAALKQYKEYVCIETVAGEQIELRVHFDNTHEPVIWEVVQRIETGVRLLQEQESEQRLQGLLSETTGTIDDIGVLREELKETRSSIKRYREQAQRAASDLNTVEQEIDDVVDILDAEVLAQQRTSENFADDTRSSALTAQSSLITAQYFLGQVTPSTEDGAEALDEVEERIDDALDTNANLADDALMKDFTSNGYWDSRSSVDQEIEVLSAARTQLNTVVNNLYAQELALDEYDESLETYEESLSGVGDVNARALLNPIDVVNIPVFIPSADRVRNLLENEDVSSAQDAVGLISLQTLFPTILLLITMFLGMLVSSFICLQEVNSPATIRLRLIKGTFFSEAHATLLSSMVITTIPVFLVVLSGQFLFRLPVLDQSGIIMGVMILLIAIFSLVGMTLSYLIRKESITLLLTTFLLVALMFFSGFFLPVERMSVVFAQIADLLPTRLTMSAFNKVVFYSQPSWVIQSELLTLGTWFVVFFGLMLGVKRLNRRK